MQGFSLNPPAWGHPAPSSSPGSPQSLGSTSPGSHRCRLFCNIVPPFTHPPQCLGFSCVAWGTVLCLSVSPRSEPHVLGPVAFSGKMRARFTGLLNARSHGICQHSRLRVPGEYLWGCQSSSHLGPQHEEAGKRGGQGGNHTVPEGLSSPRRAHCWRPTRACGPPCGNHIPDPLCSVLTDHSHLGPVSENGGGLYRRRQQSGSTESRCPPPGSPRPIYCGRKAQPVALRQCKRTEIPGVGPGPGPKCKLAWLLRLSPVPLTP